MLDLVNKISADADCPADLLSGTGQLRHVSGSCCGCCGFALVAALVTLGDIGDGPLFEIAGDLGIALIGTDNKFLATGCTFAGCVSDCHIDNPFPVLYRSLLTVFIIAESLRKVNKYIEFAQSQVTKNI